MKLLKLQRRTMPSVGIEPNTLQSRVQHPNHYATTDIRLSVFYIVVYVY